MISFVNISNFLKCKNICIMTFRAAHWNALDDGLTFQYARGRYYFDHTNAKRHVFIIYISIYKRKIFLSILMTSVIRVRFRQLVDHCVT